MGNNKHTYGLLNFDCTVDHRHVCNKHLRNARLGTAVCDSVACHARCDLLHVEARASSASPLKPNGLGRATARFRSFAVIAFAFAALLLHPSLVERVYAADVPFLSTISLTQDAGTYCEPQQSWGLCGMVFTSSSTATTTLDYVSTYMYFNAGTATSTKHIQVYVYRIPTPNSENCIKTSSVGKKTAMMAHFTPPKTSPKVKELQPLRPKAS